MTAPATNSPGPWDLEHVDGRDDVVALKDNHGDLIALLPIRRPEGRDLFMGLPIEGGQDPIQERNLEIIRLAPELLAELGKIVEWKRTIIIAMLCLAGVTERTATELADARLRFAQTLIAKARGQ